MYYEINVAKDGKNYYSISYKENDNTSFVQVLRDLPKNAKDVGNFEIIIG